MSGEPQAFRTQKERALLAYLAVERDLPHSRENLAQLFWPDRSEGIARNNLRQALFGLRQAVGSHEFDEIFTITTSDVQLNLGHQVWVDTAAFEMHMKAFQSHSQHAGDPCSYCLENLQDAVEIYRGNFLDNFILDKNQEFQSWIDSHREQYLRIQVNALTNLVDLYESGQDYAQAALYAQRLIQLGGFSEKLFSHVMLLLAKSGQYSSALEQYEIYRGKIARLPGASLSPEIAALAEKIRVDRNEFGASFSTLPQHNFPEQLTPFIGREMELSQISHSLKNPGQRLLIVIGLGGVGKTRFAIQAGMQNLALFPDGICFVQLEQVSTTVQLAEAIGRPAGLVFDGRQDSQAVLLDFLHTKRMLIILDSFERLMEARDLLLKILRVAPFTKLMITSRERLHLQAEFLIELQGLSYQKEILAEKNPEQIFLRDNLSRHSAVMLLLERASRVRSDLEFPLDGGHEFSLHDPTEIEGIVRICHLVDGLPLGIELAASWARYYSFAQIANEIQGSLDFLQTSLQDLPERHRSLRASFEHSWNLLNSSEQEIFCRLAVFPGSFSAAAAQVIAGAAFPWLVGLVDKSLVQRLSLGRYALHPMIRQYAGEKLRQISRKTEEQARQAHAQFFTDMLRECGVGLRGAAQEEAMKTLQAEQDNIAAAWAWSIEHTALDYLHQAAPGLFYYLESLSRWQEGEKSFDQAAASLLAGGMRNGNSWMVAYLLACQGWFACRLSHFDTARERLERGLALLQGTDPGQELAFIHFAMGFLEVWSGRFKEAYFQLSTSLAISEQIGDIWSAAWARQVLAEGAYESGQTAASEPFQFSLAAFEHIGDKRGMSRALNYLGIIALREGYFSQAQAYFERLLSYMERFGDVWGAAGGYGKLGQLAFVRGENERALGLYQRSLQLLQKTGDQRRIAFLLAELGEVSVTLGKQEDGEEFFRQALNLGITTRNIALAQHIMVSWSLACLQQNQAGKAAEISHLVFASPISDRSTAERAARLAEQIATHQNIMQTESLPSSLPAETLWAEISRLVDKTVKR